MDKKIEFPDGILGRESEIKALQDVYRGVRDSKDFKVGSNKMPSAVMSQANKSALQQNYRLAKSSRGLLSTIRSSRSLKNIRGESSRSMEQHVTPPISIKETVKAAYVSGLSGTGKTSLVRYALKELVESDGNYFCEGNFDMIASRRMFSAVVDALDSLCKRVKASKSKKELAALKNQFQEGLDPDVCASLLFHVPSLVGIVGDSFVPEQVRRPASLFNASSTSLHRSSMKLSLDEMTLGSSTSVAGESHFSLKHSFKKLKLGLRIMAQILMGDQVVVMFIDDLQWARVSSLGLIEEMVKVLAEYKFVFIGGYRSDEVSENDYLSRQIRDTPTLKSTITVSELSFESVVLFLAKTLSVNEAEVTALARLVHEKTGGNIFDVREYLVFMHRNSHLYYDVQERKWKWEELHVIRDSIPSEVPNMAYVISQKILRLRRQTVDALKLASCLGSRFEADSIEFVLNKWQRANLTRQSMNALIADKTVTTIEEVLWDAVENGLLEEVMADPFADKPSSNCYKWTHDKVRTAAYLLIGKRTKRVHLEIGNYLREFFELKGEVWALILAAEHLMKGEGLVNSQETRDEMAATSYQAALRLKFMSDFKLAAVLCNNAIFLLGDGAWERIYSMALSAYNLSCEMEYCSGHMTQCNERVDTILKKAMSLEDKQIAYIVRMTNQTEHLHYDEAVDTGYDLLRMMDLTNFPDKVNKSNLKVEMNSTVAALRRLSDEKILDLPVTDDEDVQLYVKVLMLIMQSAFLGRRSMDMVFVSLRAVKVSLKHGLAAFSPPAFMIYAYIRLAETGLMEESYNIGRLAMRLSRKFEAPDADVITRFFYYLGIDWTRHPIAGITDKLIEINELAFDCGSMGLSFLIAGVISASFRDGGVPLDKLASMTAVYRDLMIECDRIHALAPLRSTRQVVLNLMGRSPDPLKLEGDEIKSLDEYVAELGGHAMAKSIMISMPFLLACFFNAPDAALPLAEVNMKEWKQDMPVYLAIFYPLFRCFIWASLYRRDKEERFKINFKKDAKEIEQWAKDGSPNGKIMAVMIHAEEKAYLGGSERGSGREIRECYDRSINENIQFGFVHFAAMSAERAGRYFYSVHDPELARCFLTRSIELYRKWGAHGKVKQIAGDFGKLLDGRVR